MSLVLMRPGRAWSALTDTHVSGQPLIQTATRTVNDGHKPSMQTKPNMLQVVDSMYLVVGLVGGISPPVICVLTQI
jgi:hypothetical protein